VYKTNKYIFDKISVHWDNKGCQMACPMFIFLIRPKTASCQDLMPTSEIPLIVAPNKSRGKNKNKGKEKEGMFILYEL